MGRRVFTHFVDTTTSFQGRVKEKFLTDMTLAYSTTMGGSDRRYSFLVVFHRVVEFASYLVSLLRAQETNSTVYASTSSAFRVKDHHGYHVTNSGKSH